MNTVSQINVDIEEFSNLLIYAAESLSELDIRGRVCIKRKTQRIPDTLPGLGIVKNGSSESDIKTEKSGNLPLGVIV